MSSTQIVMTRFTTMQLRGAFAYIRGVYEIFHFLKHGSTEPLCDLIKETDSGFDICWIEEKIDRRVCSECLRLWDELIGQDRQLELLGL